MEKDFCVFVVDDDEIVLTLLEDILAEGCRVETFAAAGHCLERLSRQRPDMMIIDVNMPDLDGYALCRQLKDDFDTRDIPIVLISSSDLTDTCVAAYEAGADDFLRKPIVPAELESKVRVISRQVAASRALHEQAGFAQRTALSAMTSMGELGVVLQFLSKSFACGEPRELAQAILDALAQFDLQAAVRLRVGEDFLSLSARGENAPLDVAVLEHVSKQERIFQFRRHCVFNYGGVTLLVNNMPVEDGERCGRLRDNVALLAEGAEARLRAQEVERSNRRRQAGAMAALPQVHAALDAMQSGYRRHSFESTQLLIQFQENLAKSFVHLGLSERQEEFIISLARDFMERMAGAQDQSLAIVDRLEKLARELESLAAG